jgi:hopanoid-associated phosphorylase
MIVVVGMAFEARIVSSLGLPVICGGDGHTLQAQLTRAMAAGSSGLVSFGVAGGIAPALRPGTCVIASSVIDHDCVRYADARWAQRLARLIPGSVSGAILGVPEPIAHSHMKQALHARTGAFAIDMESHVVARAAAQHGVPFAAIRVVIDPVERTIPRSALAGSQPDGSIDPFAVMRSLMRHPRDLLGLIRMTLDARAARTTLVRGRDLLGPGLGLLDTPYMPKAALAIEAKPAAVDA